MSCVFLYGDTLIDIVEALKISLKKLFYSERHIKHGSYPAS